MSMRTLTNRRPALPGMVVSVPKGPFTHVGIISSKQCGGMPMIFASSPQTNGAAEVTWWEFGSGQAVIIHGYLGELPPGETLRCAQDLVGRLPYDAGSANCEHYVTRCLGYEPHSPTVTRCVALGLLALGAVALANEA